MKNNIELKEKFLTDTLKRNLIFITGKGGVGKSSLTWAIGLAAKRQGYKVAVAAWNPLKYPMNELEECFGVIFFELDTITAFREYVVQQIHFEKIYDSIFDNRVLRSFIKTAPGLSDTVIAGKIWDLVNKNSYDLVLVDLPASGHAVSFFGSPFGVKKIFPIGFVSREVEKIISLFQSEKTRVDIVTISEELPLIECRELKQALQEITDFNFGFLHMNQTMSWYEETVFEGREISPELQYWLKRYQKKMNLQKQRRENHLYSLQEFVQLEIPFFLVKERKEAIVKIADFLTT